MCSPRLALFLEKNCQMTLFSCSLCEKTFFLNSVQSLFLLSNLCWQGSKIVLARSYLRASQAAGQVNILIFLLKIKFSPCMPINFVMQGKCLFSDISRPGWYLHDFLVILTPLRPPPLPSYRVSTIDFLLTIKTSQLEQSQETYNPPILFFLSITKGLSGSVNRELELLVWFTLPTYGLHMY